MRKLFTLYKIELKLVIREISGVLFGIAIPVGLMILLGALYGDSTHDDTSIKMLQLAVPGVLTIGICASGLMGLPLAIANYRDKRILRRFQVTPTSPLFLLTVQVMVQATIAIISSILVVSIATLFFGYEMAGNPLLFITMYLLVLLAIFSLGMLIASVSNNVNTASLLAIVLYFPMLLLSGATIPFEILPSSLQTASKIFPLTQGIILLKEISLDLTPNINVLTIVMLIVISGISIIISQKVFKYDYRS